MKYLRRFEDFDGNEIKMASFENWVEFISNKIEERFQSKQVYVFGTHTLAFDMSCYQEVIKPFIYINLPQHCFKFVFELKVGNCVHPFYLLAASR